MTSINRTFDYHRRGPIDLLTEFTVCESLAHERSPYMIALEEKKSYGALVGAFLHRSGLLTGGCRVCEIGGGYGSLMRGFLETYSSSIGHVIMTDLSLYLLKRQREKLRPWSGRVSLVCGDVLDILPALSGVDLFICNEMMGDLDTWKDLDPDRLPEAVDRFFRAYGLDRPAREPFHVNLGALSLVEALCRKGVPAFLTEHAADPVIPDGMEYLAKGLDPDGYPREIRLKDHSEFTVRFSHLAAIAGGWDRKVETGSLLDFIGVKKTPAMGFIFRMRAPWTEEQEILLEFLDHAREYRWLLIH